MDSQEDKTLAFKWTDLVLSWHANIKQKRSMLKWIFNIKTLTAELK